MADYKITIENKMFKEHLNNIRQDPTTKNAKNFNGDEWMVPILTEMQKAEDNIEIQIQIDKARIYEQSKRLTNYITIMDTANYAQQNIQSSLSINRMKTKAIHLRLKKQLSITTNSIQKSWKIKYQSEVKIEKT